MEQEHVGKLFGRDVDIFTVEVKLDGWMTVIILHIVKCHPSLEQLLVTL